MCVFIACVFICFPHNLPCRSVEGDPARHQCLSFFFLPPSPSFFYSSPSFHTGRVLTPLAEFTDLSDCGLNAARLVFSTCPSRFATLAAQFPPNSNYSSARYAPRPAPRLIRADAAVH